MLRFTWPQTCNVLFCVMVFTGASWDSGAMHKSESPPSIRTSEIKIIHSSNSGSFFLLAALMLSTSARYAFPNIRWLENIEEKKKRNFLRLRSFNMRHVRGQRGEWEMLKFWSVLRVLLCRFGKYSKVWCEFFRLLALCLFLPLRFLHSSLRFDVILAHFLLLLWKQRNSSFSKPSKMCIYESITPAKTAESRC